MPEETKLFKVEYVATQPRIFYLGPKKKTLQLPRQGEGKDNIIEVLAAEMKCLLGMRDGNKPCFIEVKKRQVKKEEERE